MIVLNLHVFMATDIRERKDPPPGVTGRLGGVHIRRAARGSHHLGLDLILSTGYAFQNTEPEQKRQHFWDAVQHKVLGLRGHKDEGHKSQGHKGPVLQGS